MLYYSVLSCYYMYCTIDQCCAMSWHAVLKRTIYCTVLQKIVDLVASYTSLLFGIWTVEQLWSRGCDVCVKWGIYPHYPEIYSPTPPPPVSSKFNIFPREGERILKLDYCLLLVKSVMSLSSNSSANVLCQRPRPKQVLYKEELICARVIFQGRI